MLIIGLTGGIATGKSTVSKRLRTHYHIPIVDADVIAREVVEPGQPAYKAIVDHFQAITPDLLDSQAGLNRAALGRTIFGNEKERKVLNSIVHPAVRKAMLKQVLWAWLSGHSMVILDVPLLFESKLHGYCGTTIVVACDDETQMQRLLERDQGLTAAEAKDRVASQMKIEAKIELAQHVIDNNGSLEQLFANVDKVITEIRPSTLRTLLEWFPPFGIVAAAISYFSH